MSEDWSEGSEQDLWLDRDESAMENEAVVSDDCHHALDAEGRAQWTSVRGGDLPR